MEQKESIYYIYYNAERLISAPSEMRGGHFNYEEICDLLDGKAFGDKGYTEYDFLKIISKAAAEDKICPLITILSEKEKCLGNYFEAAKDKYRLEVEKLLAELNVNLSLQDSFRDALRKCTRKIAGLSKMQAYELLRAFALFGYINRVPNEDEIRQICERMKITLENQIDNTQCGTEDEEGNSGKALLKMQTLVNPSTETKKLKMNDGSLQRHLLPGEELTVLLSNGKVSAFFPRICAASEQIVYYDTKSGCVTATNDAGRVETLSVENASGFVSSKKYGLLVLQKAGSFNREQFRGKLPDWGKICWFSAGSDNYGFLTEEGEYKGVRPCPAWEKERLLCFDLQDKGEIAITLDRQAMDPSGRILGENVAWASRYGNAFVLLHMDGTIYTEAGKVEGITRGRAICADATGYWISTDTQLICLSRKNWEICRFDIPMDEIVRDELGICVYGITTDGEIRKLES